MIKTEAIVLHRYPYSDSSWIVKVLTEESGIVSFILKGAKRKDSPFKGAMDPLALSEVVFHQKPGTELQFVKEATLLSWHSEIRENLESLAVAQVMAEILYRYAPPGVPLEEEFHLLKNALQQLDQKSPSTTVFSKWLLDACDMWGYHLELNQCGRCEKMLEEPAADFHPETGVFLCKHCLGVETPRARPETMADIWNLFTSKELQNKQYVENALLAYLRNHIGFLKEIKSLQFLNETRKLYLPR